jgi:hypothetical protein
MLARNTYLLGDRVGPLAYLSLALVLTVAWIGLLGYGLLVLLGH